MKASSGRAIAIGSQRSNERAESGRRDDDAPAVERSQ
ncbi:hypothetical protein X737_36410 [Mesorhizobium sp. L48C026A00]|nr:hypothetical protein X737_36410 [Mesorhizobium sp. L48C026A00]